MKPRPLCLGSNSSQCNIYCPFFLIIGQIFMQAPFIVHARKYHYFSLLLFWVFYTVQDICNFCLPGKACSTYYILLIIPNADTAQKAGQGISLHYNK